MIDRVVTKCHLLTFRFQFDNKRTCLFSALLWHQHERMNRLQEELAKKRQSLERISYNTKDLERRLELRNSRNCKSALLSVQVSGHRLIYSTYINIVVYLKCA